MYNSTSPSRATGRLRRAGGLTLMEVAMAMAIVGVLVISFLFIQRMNWKIASNTRLCYQAADAIEQELENIRTTIAASPLDSFPPKSRTRVDGPITMTITVDSALSLIEANDTIANVAKLTVRALWPQDSLSFVTYMARNY